MRKLSKERCRVATICAACAAIIPSTGLLMVGSHSPNAHFAGGLVVGMAFAMLTLTFVKRKRCAE